MGLFDSMYPVNSREKRRVQKAAKALPDLIRAAVAIHGKGRRAEVAVLSAWGDLAGVLGWTPEMVERVEEAMRRHA